MELASPCARKATLEFDDPDLLEVLEQADAGELDQAEFGIVALEPDGTVRVYNRYESSLSGFPSDKVLGQPFFGAVAPCMNRPAVAYRFADSERLDETIDYVFTLRMRPTPVRLRLLKAPEARYQYLLVCKIAG